MSSYGYDVYSVFVFQIAIVLFILTALAIPLGEYMAKVFSGKRCLLSPILEPVENFLYKIFGIDQDEDMDWKTYLINLLLFNFIGLVVLFLIQELQGILPLNPEKFKMLRWDIAFNTAISFVTQTNWQAYKPEINLSYLTQMLGLGVQNFLSAATAIAVAFAFINGIIRKTTSSIGNFWVYLTRSLLYVLLPLSIILAILLVSQGSIENLNPYVHAQTLEGKEQIIAQGPAASQIAIKVLGNNGGGFFAANSAHPYENPTPITDFLQILSLLLIPAAFPFAFGVLINNRAQGYALFAVMMLLFITGLSIALWSETNGNPLLAKIGVSEGVNLEGKEMRFGLLSSVFFTESTTATSTGAVNASLDSMLPITGLISIFNIALGELIFGGGGSGFVYMVIYAMLTMFLVGLMIGKIPEIYGKKLGPRDMTIIVAAVFLPCIFNLILSAVAAYNDPSGLSVRNPFVHSLSEILYAYTSSIGNNGSSFDGLITNTRFYNLTTAFAMLTGRFIFIISSLALAGSMANKKIAPSNFSFPTNGFLFIFVLTVVIIIIGALTLFPVLVLGPILEHLYIY